MVETAAEIEGGSVCGGLDPTGPSGRGGAWVGIKKLSLRLVVGNELCVWFSTGALGEWREGSPAVVGERPQVLSSHGSPCVKFLAWNTCPPTVFSRIPTSRKTVFMTVRQPTLVIVRQGAFTPLSVVYTDVTCVQRVAGSACALKPSKPTGDIVYRRCVQESDCSHICDSKE